MSKLLLLETATPVCSVVLSINGQKVAEAISDEPNAHSAKLSLFIGDVMRRAGVALSELDAVCVSSGPGSYTGLRIGVSSAKGLCYALGLPLLSVPTLEGIASLYFRRNPDYRGWVCPMIDARRMECYTAVYDAQGNAIKPTSADIIEEGIYDTYLNQQPVVFVGDGASKTQSILGTHANALYDNTFCISAEGMIDIAEAKLKEGRTEDVAYFEPFYLKDFVAKKPTVKGLR